MALTVGIISLLFKSEDSPTRFERVCLDLYREAEGVDLVGTSQTWDLGRNGRRISIGHRALEGVLCATLDRDLDEKIENDIKRLGMTTETKAIVYCTSQELSEQSCDDLEARIRVLYPDAESVRVLGQRQLVDLGQRYEHVLNRHYAGELENIKQALIEEKPHEPEVEKVGLRLALMTQTTDDARQLRQELSRRLVLEALKLHGSQTPGQLAATISRQLHLPRSVTGHYIEEIIRELEDNKYVTIEDCKTLITTQGINYIATLPEGAVGKLLEGRVAVRKAIKLLSGHTLSDDQYERLWSCFQDALSDLFYFHGASIVQMICSLMNEESIAPRELIAHSYLDQMSKKIKSLFSDPSQGEDVAQAILDMFTEKETDAFKWLTQICTVYVMMCSLGFETFSSQQVENVLKSLKLVPDSDVILSLLCEGERNHPAVQRVLGGWKALGGELLMSKPVLEEVAYHAWISQNDYLQVVDLFDRLTDIEAERIIENAFVRTFRKISPNPRRQNLWGLFINQFRGLSDRDYGSVMQLLREEHGFGQLQEAPRDCDQFAQEVLGFLKQSASQDYGCEIDDLDYRMQDKCVRDSKLLASVYASRAAARTAGFRETTIVLSSATLLKLADQHFREKLGQPDAVLSVVALGCLLALTPGVNMGLGTLRGVLFDLGLAHKFSSAQRYAYRLDRKVGSI
jgi:hypothetical protein